MQTYFVQVKGRDSSSAVAMSRPIPLEPSSKFKASPPGNSRQSGQGQDEPCPRQQSTSASSSSAVALTRANVEALEAVEAVEGKTPLLDDNTPLAELIKYNPKAKAKRKKPRSRSRSREGSKSSGIVVFSPSDFTSADDVEI